MRTNRHTTPGSTFKVIMGLALIKAAIEKRGEYPGSGSGPYLDAIRGIWNVRKNSDAPGLALPEGVVIENEGLKIPRRSRLIRNASHEHRDGYLSPDCSLCPPLGTEKKNRRGPNCGKGAKAPRQYGLCEALYAFAQYPVYIDRTRVGLRTGWSSGR